MTLHDSTRRRRFWSHVAVAGPDDCWLWLAATDKDGYGKFADRTRGLDRAHRFAWAVAHPGEPLPEDTMHTCDTPACVNQRHLRGGTKVLNRADCVRKNRHAAGERHGRTKLSVAAVKSILRSHAAGVGSWRLAREFGVSRTAVKNILRRKTWRHVSVD